MILLLSLMALVSIICTSNAQPPSVEGFPIHGIPTAGIHGGIPRPEFSSPLVFDLTGDGYQDVVVTGRRDIWVFDESHTSVDNPVAHFQLPGGELSEFTGPVSLAFPSSDGLPWLIAGASRASFYSRNVGDEPYPGCGGCNANDWESGQSHCPADRVYAAEVHGHGSCQHFFSKVYAIQCDGAILTAVVSEEVPMRLATPACADLDNDMEDEIVFFGPSSWGIFAGPPGEDTDEVQWSANSRLSVWKVSNADAVVEIDNEIAYQSFSNWNEVYIHRYIACWSSEEMGHFFS